MPLRRSVCALVIAVLGTAGLIALTTVIPAPAEDIDPATRRYADTSWDSFPEEGKSAVCQDIEANGADWYADYVRETARELGQPLEFDADQLAGLFADKCAERES